MISAKIIADTIFNGKRITTMQLQMPRFILSQFNKHRAFSNNAASSRAVPVAKMIERVQNEPVIPVYWGENQAGMVAEKEMSAEKQEQANKLWLEAATNAVETAKKLNELGCHKQIANRVLEPFMWADVVVTATEWDNFFRLRLEHDSQPEMQELARCMKEAMDKSKPVKRKYHLPYVRYDEIEEICDEYDDTLDSYLSDAYDILAKISAARCARVSYLNHDQSKPNIDKDLELAERLFKARHLTCFEHQAMVNEFNLTFEYLANEVPSGNFIGWGQYRQE